MDDGPQPVIRPRRKLLRYALYALGCGALVVGGVIAYLAATFDPRDHHDRIVSLVKDATGRTLEIRGEMTLSFWPDLAVRLGSLTLSERGSAEPFAAVESARVRLETWPLMSRELIASELAIVGADVRITRYEDGRLNIDDLLAGEGGPPRFDIGRFVLERSTIRYDDRGSGATYVLSDIGLETGRLTNGVATPVKLSLSARDGAGKFAVKAVLAARATFDLPAKRYAFDDARLKVDGRVPGVGEMKSEAQGAAALDLKSGEIRLSGLSGSAAGSYGEDAVTVTASSAAVRASPGKASAETVSVNVVAKGPAGATELKLVAPALDRVTDRIASEAATLDVTIDRGGHRLQAAVASPFSFVPSVHDISLPRLDAKFTVTGPRLPRAGVAGTLQGETHLDLLKEGVLLRVAGRVGESHVKANFTAAGFASPVYTFVVDIDHLDLDRYLVGDPLTGRPTQPAAAAAARNLLEPFEALPASGTLSIGTLTTRGSKAGSVKLVLK